MVEKQQEQKSSKEFRHIVRIADTDLDGNKRIYHALRKIKGVGFTYANMACVLANVNIEKKAGNLEDEEIQRLNQLFQDPRKFNVPSWMVNRRKDFETGEDNHLINSDLEWSTQSDIKLLKKIKSYRGFRHYYKLPVRGQRTRSNFRKNKGKVQGVTKKAMQAQKKSSVKPKDSGKGKK